MSKYDLGKIIRENALKKIPLFKAGSDSNDKWRGAPNEIYHSLGNNTYKGDVVEESVAQLCAQIGHNVYSKGSRIGEYDTRVNGIDIEDKGAGEDTTGKFQFNHVRKDRQYDYLLLIGISPTEILFDIFSKDDVLNGNAGTLTPMGKDQGGMGNEGTFKITKSSQELIVWPSDGLHPMLERVLSGKGLSKEDVIYETKPNIAKKEHQPTDPLFLQKEIKEVFHRNNTKDYLPKLYLINLVAGKLSAETTDFGHLVKELESFIKLNEGELFDIKRGKGGGIRLRRDK